MLYEDEDERYHTCVEEDDMTERTSKRHDIVWVEEYKRWVLTVYTTENGTYVEEFQFKTKEEAIARSERKRKERTI